MLFSYIFKGLLDLNQKFSSNQKCFSGQNQSNKKLLQNEKKISIWRLFKIYSIHL